MEKLENLPIRESLPNEGMADRFIDAVQGVTGVLQLQERACQVHFDAHDDIVELWIVADGKPDASGTITPSLALCFLANASPDWRHDFLLPCVGEEVSDIANGYPIKLHTAEECASWGTPRSTLPNGLAGHDADGRIAFVGLDPLAIDALMFHPHARLQRDMAPGAGVLAHITSLPATTGTDGKAQDASTNDPADAAPTGHPAQPARAGAMGDAARAFIDWLADAGVRYWQVLPVNPTDDFGSPYAGISAFAGNMRLVESAQGDPESRGGAHALDPDAYRAFCQREAEWLEPFACFTAIRQHLGEGIPWQDWPEPYRAYNPAVVESDPELAGIAERCRRDQFAFDGQWRELRAYAHERGIQIIGDIPIYVSANSADTWAHPELFQLGADGRPENVAGCPPDAFAEDGQIWGNPLYDWDALRTKGYDWWMRRLKRSFALYDFVRLDHFIGFVRYFAIPDGKPATEGRYHAGPGLDFFQHAFAQFGPLPLVAEDLGTITPAVRALCAACGFPGMDVLQFVDGNDPLGWYEPRPCKVVYTGTHDNQTLVGYAAERYPHLDARETADALARKALASSADVVVLPLQDVLGLDDSARMNTPGTTGDNWTWQADAAAVADATPYLHSLMNRG